MADEIMKELWEIKDGISREHGNDLDSLIVFLRSRRISDGRNVVDLRAIKKKADQSAALDGDSAALHPRQ